MTQPERPPIPSVDNEPRVAELNRALPRVKLPGFARLVEIVADQERFHVLGRNEIQSLEPFAERDMTSLEVAVVLRVEVDKAATRADDVREIVRINYDQPHEDIVRYGLEHINLKSRAGFMDASAIIDELFPDPVAAMAGHDFLENWIRKIDNLQR